MVSRESLVILGQQYITPTMEVSVNQRIRRKMTAVRLLEQAAKLAAKTNGLLDQSDRSILDLGRYMGKLKGLVKHDPEDKFWQVFQRANLKLLKYLLRSRDWPIR